ncbi:hypothetical protein [Thermoactinospora rubra]|uniref:hypothetical protein n=1 Tax=Thermoactinospora rubra TaxID=1088767 RepID=UPI000A11EAC8|nr:hypothetical protein [Thermoactinospora rubra]
MHGLLWVASRSDLAGSTASLVLGTPLHVVAGIPDHASTAITKAAGGHLVKGGKYDAAETAITGALLPCEVVIRVDAMGSREAVSLYGAAVQHSFTRRRALLP